MCWAAGRARSRPFANYGATCFAFGRWCRGGRAAAAAAARGQASAVAAAVAEAAVAERPLLLTRVALLVRRRFRREVDALAAEIGTVRVSTLSIIGCRYGVLIRVTILSRSARAFASRRSKSATDRACPVSV